MAKRWNPQHQNLNGPRLQNIWLIPHLFKSLSYSCYHLKAYKMGAESASAGGLCACVGEFGWDVRKRNIFKKY